MSEIMLISDAAKEVNVENHVLRYWEEELHLPIKRNELGHRYYTKEDVVRFKQIKSMKERGLQLKAIKMILRDGRIDVLPQEKSAQKKGQETESVMYHTESPQMAIDIVDSREVDHKEIDHRQIGQKVKQENEIVQESREDKTRRLQWILQQLIRETLQENNQQLCRDIKESVVKELDYQFRIQEERDDERDRRQSERDEQYYKKMDELLRKKTKRAWMEGKRKNTLESQNVIEKKSEKAEKEKKKRHSIF